MRFLHFVITLGWIPVFWSACLSADEPAPAHAAPESDSGRGLRSLSIGYESLKFADSFRGTDRQEGGKANMESLQFAVVYGLNPNWSVSASIPMVRKRYRGDSPHNPAFLDAPNNTAPFIDDGEYHGGWQDFRFGLQYDRDFAGFLWSPYLNVVLPSHDYPHFGQAAIGQNRQRLQIGVGIGRVLETQPFYYRLDLSHVLVEKTLGQSTDHNIVDLTLGWFVSDRVSLSLFGRKKSGQGVDPSNREFFGRPPFRNEAWYQHDRLFPHEYELVGIGSDWQIDDRYGLSLSVAQMIGGNFVQRIDLATSLTLTRRFGP